MSRADYIKALVDAAPPLSETQRSRLATILRAPMRANTTGKASPRTSVRQAA